MERYIYSHTPSPPRQSMVIKCIFQVGRQGKRQRFTLLIKPKKLHFLLGLINKLKKKQKSAASLYLTGIPKELHLRTVCSVVGSEVLAHTLLLRGRGTASLLLCISSPAILPPRGATCVPYDRLRGARRTVPCTEMLGMQECRSFWKDFSLSLLW